MTTDVIRRHITIRVDRDDCHVQADFPWQDQEFNAGMGYYLRQNLLHEMKRFGVL